MERCKDDTEREYYIHMTRKLRWIKNVLIHQIENQTYEKTLLNQTNLEQTFPAEIRNQAKHAVRDEYTFDFLELGMSITNASLSRLLSRKLSRSCAKWEEYFHSPAANIA